MPAGRPSEYKPEYATEARKLAQLGATDIQIADFFEVSERTLYRWKYDNPEFSQALKLGKDDADEQVIKSLYRRAIGFEHDAVKIFLPKGSEQPIYAPYREHVAPDTTACIFWLKNRKSTEWRDRQEIEHAMMLQIVMPESVAARFAGVIDAPRDASPPSAALPTPSVSSPNDGD